MLVTGRWISISFLFLFSLTAIAQRGSDPILFPNQPDHTTQAEKEESAKKAKLAVDGYGVADAAVAFTCLKPDTFLPKIILNVVGNDEASKAKEASLFKEASDGKCALMKQGLFCGDTKQISKVIADENLSVNTKLFGIERAYPHGLVAILNAFEIARSATPATLAKSIRAAKEELARGVFENKVAKSTLSEVGIVNDAPQTAMKKVFTEMFKDPSLDIAMKRAVSADDNLRAFKDLLASWARVYVKKSKAEKDLVPVNLEKIVEDFLSGKDRLSVAMILDNEYAARWQARNLIKQYCDVLPTMRDPMTVEVTLRRGNVPAVAALLKKASGGKIVVEEKSAELDSILPKLGK